MGVQALLEDESVFLTLGGLETTLHFESQFPLREMAAFEFLFSSEWKEYVEKLQSSFIDTACKAGRPMLLDTPTWRASSKWYDMLDTPLQDRQRVIKLAADFARNLASRMEDKSAGKLIPVIQGLVGPQFDGYTCNEQTSLQEASRYHSVLVKELADAGVDIISPSTMTNSTEALAIAAEANKVGIPCAVSFTLNTDGRLPSGETLKQAIQRIDSEASPTPLFYMVNCTHPVHIKPVLVEALSNRENWIRRLRGIRGNASSKSHDELDNCDELDKGNPEEWAKEMQALRRLHPQLSILGGCCGTGVRHCQELAKLVHAK